MMIDGIPAPGPSILTKRTLLTASLRFVQGRRLDMSFAMLMDPMDPKISLPSVRGIRMSWRWTEGLNFFCLKMMGKHGGNMGKLENPVVYHHVSYQNIQYSHFEEV